MIGFCESHDIGTGNQTQEEQYLLLTAKPSRLSSPYLSFLLSTFRNGPAPKSYIQAPLKKPCAFVCQESSALDMTPGSPGLRL